MNSNKINVRRSFIFTPGLKPEMFPKAIASGADMVCIELEDGIAIKDKDEARKNTIDALKNLEVKNGVELVVRVNCQRTKFGLLDLEAFISSKLPIKALMLPKVKTRREGYRNLHKINRYGLLLRSDLVLRLYKKFNSEIEDIPSVKSMINNKYFCSLLVGKNQNILYEKYAKDFSENQPQTIMSITKMFINLFIGKLVEQKSIDLNKKISDYLPNIGSGYASATIQNVLDMNIQNSYSEESGFIRSTPTPQHPPTICVPFCTHDFTSFK